MGRILVIPLFAAVWMGTSGYASAQVAGIDHKRTVLASAEQRPARGGGGGGNRGSGGGGGGDRGATRGGDRGATSSGGDRARTGPVDAGRIEGSRPPRGGAPVYVQGRPPVVVGSPYRQAYAYPAYRYDPWIRHYYGWSPVRYAPWAWIYGTSALAGFYSGYYWPYYSGYYASPYYAPYPYYYGLAPYYGSAPYYPPYPQSSYYSSGSTTSSTFDTGAVRIRVRPRDAQVFVDGALAGVVNDFDGVFQELRLPQGAHKIEIRMQGYETASFDVYVQPGRTIDLRQDLQRIP